MSKYIFCVDSDGCAMDTMTYKHQLFFGPLAAELFQVTDKENFLKEWDRVNLFSKTRGINRFVGLVTGLEFAGVERIDALKTWVNTTMSLSNQSLEAAIARTDEPDLRRALEWSNAVNVGIKLYDGEVSAFKGVKEGLAKLKTLGDVCVVSSANKEAVVQEWTEQGLTAFVDTIYCQDSGKKEDIIAMLIRDGYAKDNIMMIGDSPGDLVASEQNGVAFYPILVGKEDSSWQLLTESIAERFAKQQLSDTEKNEFIKQFWENLE